MQKRKKWQFFLILTVICLTIYNILPTVFYYAKPLNEPIGATKSQKIAKDIAIRVNSLEDQSIDWVHSFCDLLNIQPLSVEIDPENPQEIAVDFHRLEDAKAFRQFLPRAGALIAFSPEQLSLNTMEQNESRHVRVFRKVPLHFSLDQLSKYFKFTSKRLEDGSIAPMYQQVTLDRVAQIGQSVGGASESAVILATIVDNPSNASSDDLAYTLAANILRYTQIFGENSPITSRYFESFTQGNFSNHSQAIQSMISSFEKSRDQLRAKKIAIETEEKLAKENNQIFEEEKKQQLKVLETKEDTFLAAEALVKKHKSKFTQGQTPWEHTSLFEKLMAENNHEVQSLFVGRRNPFIDQIQVNWTQGKVTFTLHPDVMEYRKQLNSKSSSAYKKNQFEQLLLNEVARVHRQTDETLTSDAHHYVVDLDDLTNSQSMLVLDLPAIANEQSKQIQKIIETSWIPKNPELNRSSFPIYDAETYNNLPADQKSLCLVVYAPSQSKESGLRANSIYVVAKGIERILQKYQEHADSTEAQSFLEGFSQLRTLLQQNGFYGYSGKAVTVSPKFSSDFIFEKDDFSSSLIAATRESFHIHGSKKYATLEFTNLEQRILTLNKIETSMQESLVKWRDDFLSAQVDMNKGTNKEVPKPTKNVIWENLKLSVAKYFRGDDRKVIHWGLDLSGGKTVQIELRDNNNQIVTSDAALTQGINELYNRVNKIGVSEVNIRQEGSNIVLDFPGSQGLSAAELVKASSMYFHVVNEKFSTQNRNLAQHVNQFLQEVWNEAVVTNRKDSDSINEIAWKHLYGETLDTQVVEPRSEAAKVLYTNGLRLSSPESSISTSTYNDSLSKVAVLRGKDFNEWQGQTHPLMFVFHNYALEGSNLQNVRSAYDPSKGNFLSFEVRGPYTKKNGEKAQPRDELYAWTSQFSKEKILGTVNEEYSQGRGWRMCAILNGTVISSPALESALKDSAMITGNFSQREVNKLVADLKAGSLTYTPKILSEKNVSPELGYKDRTQGILAMLLAFVLVVGGMIGYYRFAGLVASVAVLFNLLIMWATLQNLQATLTLAGIAGIILTVGMAVDANVLVFERIREEFAATGKIASAIQIGYKKAFSAIFDSNITTILAALILLNFDAGPIKAFAVMIIIGIASSMFTALFMTRFFFAGWVQNPKNKNLTMMNFVKSANFDFLKRRKLAFAIAGCIILVGVFSFSTQRYSIFGMDFTGGYSLTMELPVSQEANYRQDVENAFKNAGAASNDFQVRQLNPANNVKVLFGPGMELEGSPFYKLPLVEDKKGAEFSYLTNPRIVWVVNALSSQGIEFSASTLKSIDSNWSSVSGQMSDSMRNNAMMGLLLAFACILVYLTIRFEFKYAISALLCLIHDVLITISAVAILHALKVPTQIDMHAIAALMTIIGYSLNDTIIIFDRIREDLKTQRKMTFLEIINHSLNVTLSRTTITSATTLVVLLALVLFGGASIFSFALIMAIGVVVGTFSSLFIASPLMLLFHQREQSKEEKDLALKSSDLR